MEKRELPKDGPKANKRIHALIRRLERRLAECSR